MKRDIIFIIICSQIIIILIAGIFIRGVKDKSIIENRNLGQFPVIDYITYIDTSFQDELENALSDQIYSGDTFKELYNNIVSGSMDLSILFIKSIQSEKKINIDSNKNETEKTEVVSQSSIHIKDVDIIKTTEPSKVIIKNTPVPTITPAASMSPTPSISPTPASALKIVEKTSKATPTPYPTPNIVHYVIEPDYVDYKEPVVSTFNIEVAPAGGGLALINESQHLVYPKNSISKADKLFASKAKNYNTLVLNHPELQFYCYYIETDVDIDFINGKISHDLPINFQSRLNENIGFDYLYIDSPEKYQNYYFKTDHHWAMEGQYNGYNDIIRLLKGKNEKLLSIKAMKFPNIKYYGYKAKSTNKYSIADPFGLIMASLPTHKEYINDKERSYNRKYSYSKGKFSMKKGVNHYAACYGYDCGKVKFSFQNDNSENLVIFSASFSNPINELIASHFNDTYIIDLRYYERDLGEKFRFSKFIEDNEIDKVLFLGYYYFHANDRLLINY
jgi:hypothetical protein